MSDEYSHLNDIPREALQLSDEERIARIRSARWIGYTRAREILDQLEDLLTHPKKHRMPNLLIYGDTNNGKTMIVNRFHQLHLAHDNAEGDAAIIPVLIIQCPPVPDENRFYNAILDKLFAPRSGAGECRHLDDQRPHRRLIPRPGRTQERPLYSGSGDGNGHMADHPAIQLRDS